MMALDVLMPWKNTRAIVCESCAKCLCVSCRGCRARLPHVLAFAGVCVCAAAVVCLSQHAGWRGGFSRGAMKGASRGLGCHGGGWDIAGDRTVDALQACGRNLCQSKVLPTGCESLQAEEPRYVVDSIRGGGRLWNIACCQQVSPRAATQPATQACAPRQCWSDP